MAELRHLEDALRWHALGLAGDVLEGAREHGIAAQNGHVVAIHLQGGHEARQAAQTQARVHLSGAHGGGRSPPADWC